MQTIIYTNCKREAANYEVDKICFADRVDMSQLIQEEMIKHNIRHVHFWIITDNIGNIEGVSEEKLLLGVAKYLTENKEMSFEFQYVLKKYTSSLETKCIKKGSGQEIGFWEGKKHKTAINSLMGESLSQTVQMAASFRHESLQSSFQKSKPRLMQEQVLKHSLKHASLSQFQAFLNKQSKPNPLPQAVKRCIFKTSQQSITISFIESKNKNLIKKIIEQECDRFYDAQLKKKATFGANQGYQDLLKRYSHIGSARTLYNKVILFLFCAQKNQKMPMAHRTTKLMQAKAVPSIQALNQWKIKEENVDMIAKLEKEGDLIKQEIENQKIIFRNKIKMIQSYIGEAINVQRLMQQEELIQSITHLNTSATQKKPPKRDSTVQPSQLAQNKFSVDPYVSSQFKRLKDKSEAMRNIDNTLLEQNKKIDSGNKKIKDLIKLKESIVFSNACDLNRLRQEILQAKSQIARKEIQINQNQKNGTLTQILHYKSKQPSITAKKTLQMYKQFCNDFKTPKCYQLAADSNALQTKNRFQIKLNSQNKSLHRSLHSGSLAKFDINSQTFNEKLRRKRLQDAQVCLKDLNQKKEENFKDNTKLVKKSIMIGHERLNEQLEYTINNAETIETLKHEAKIQKMYQQLINLFEYYNKTAEVYKEMDTQISSYRTVKQEPLNTYIKEITSTDKSRNFTKSNFKDTPLYGCFSQFELESFPILKDYVLKAIQEKEDKPIDNVQTKNQQIFLPFRQQLTYPRDCFQLMLYNGKRQKKVESNMKTTTSIKSEPYDRIIQEPLQLQKAQKPPASQIKPVRQKRITIQQAIKLGNQFNMQKIK